MNDKFNFEIEQLLNDQEDSNLAQADNSDHASSNSKLKSLNLDSEKSRNSENIIPNEFYQKQDEVNPVMKNDCDLIMEKFSSL